MSTTSAAPLDAPRPFSTIRTTLYDLIAALNAQADPDDEHAAVATIVHMLDTGQITFADELDDL
jgi:hypothetical protein